MFSDNTIVPTPISTIDLYYHKAMCLIPDIKSCNGKIPDGTKLIYHLSPNKDCNQPHMLFQYLSDGTLVHHCSKKKVCPSKDRKFLILSSSCADEESKFYRTRVRSCFKI